MRAYHIRKGHVVPYYTKKDFDWNDTSKWIHDQNAINYWLTHIKPNRGDNDPDDFTTKTY